MNSKRALEIVNNREICDVYYKDHVVWIQEVNNDIATIGFIDNNIEKNVSIDELYENN